MEGREVPGHWEGDLIIRKNHKSALGTLVERTTGHVILAPIPRKRDAKSVREAFPKVFNQNGPISSFPSKAHKKARAECCDC